MNIISKITKGSERSVAVKKNILGSLIVKGVSIVISLMLVPMTLGYVSQELYGIWLTLSSVMMMLSFFDVGFSLGLKNKLAEAIALGQWDRGRSLVSTTYLMMVIIFVPLCLVLELIIPFIDWASFLNVDSVYNDDVIKSMFVVAACFCLQMIFHTITVIVAAFQKVALSNTFPVLGNIISLIVILVLTHTCESSLVLLTATLSAAPIIIMAIATVILFSTSFKKVRPSFKYASKEYVKDLWSLGYKFFLIQIQVVVMYQATNFLISNVSGPNDVTAYNISYRYLNVAMMIYNIILSPMWPAFTDAYARKDYQWMNSMYKKMVKIFAASAIIMIVMVIISPISYKIWIHDRAVIPLEMTIAVCIYMIINTWNNLHTISLNGFGKIKMQTIISLTAVAIHIPFSLLLGQMFQGRGVIYSLAILTFLSSIFYYYQVRMILNNTAHGIWNK